MTPEEITDGFWNGNADVHAEIFHRLAPNICAKFGFDIDTAKDIVQQMLYEVFKAKKTITGDLYKYLYKACYNIAADYLEEKHKHNLWKKSQSIKVNDHKDTQLEREEDIQQEAKEQLLMQRAFGQLLEDCKKILSLKYVEKLEYKEVVEAFNQLKQASEYINENAARQRSSYCRTKLKAIFKQLKQKKDAQ